MKAVLQRVSEGSVSVDGRVVGSIGKGLVVLLGVGQDDEKKDLDILVRKIVGLRIFDDAEGKTNLSILDVDGEMLVISQFTLLADCKKGRRPSFFHAGSPDKAEAMYEDFIAACRKEVRKVDHGIFGAVMKVSIQNEGPFTIVLDSREL